VTYKTGFGFHAENTASLLLEGVFTTTLHSNGSYSLVACIFFAVGMCLPSHYLAMNVYSDFTIPAFGSHATILYVCKPI
jgi:hypothetical protein